MIETLRVRNINPGWRTTLGLLCLASNARGELVDRVAAVVNKDIIALSELEKRAAPELAQAAGERDLSRRATKRNEVLRQVLDLMIGEKLMDAAVKDHHPACGDHEVENAIKEVKKPHHLDKQKLEEAVHCEGLTLLKY